jgi:hypothetical protein
VCAGSDYGRRSYFSQRPSTQRPEWKILLFSGQTTTQHLLKDARCQGNTFQSLQKPVHPSEMLVRIRALAADRRYSFILRSKSRQVNPELRRVTTESCEWTPRQDDSHVNG